ncbi:MAG: phosphopantetheine-binding protein [Bacteroidales bacterium]|nr:phosphopantetheine-binding protein [Bacteroidales bacterium]
MATAELINEVKEHIIDVLHLEDITPADIENDAPLFGDGLGLDSIDALELIVMLEKQYGIRIANPADGKDVFKSVTSIAEFVASHKA